MTLLCPSRTHPLFFLTTTYLISRCRWLFLQTPVECFCPNLGYFSSGVFKARLFIVSRHTVPSHSWPPSVIQSSHTRTVSSKCDYISMTPSCASGKPPFACRLPGLSLNLSSHCALPFFLLPGGRGDGVGGGRLPVRTQTNTTFNIVILEGLETQHSPPTPHLPPTSAQFPPFSVCRALAPGSQSSGVVSHA